MAASTGEPLGGAGEGEEGASGWSRLLTDGGGAAGGAAPARPSFQPTKPERATAHRRRAWGRDAGGPANSGALGGSAGRLSSEPETVPLRRDRASLSVEERGTRSTCGQGAPLAERRQKHSASAEPVVVRHAHGSPIAADTGAGAQRGAFECEFRRRRRVARSAAASVPMFRPVPIEVHEISDDELEPGEIDDEGPPPPPAPFLPVDGATVALSRVASAHAAATRAAAQVETLALSLREACAQATAGAFGEVAAPDLPLTRL